MVLKREKKKKNTSCWLAVIETLLGGKCNSAVSHHSIIVHNSTPWIVSFPYWLLHVYAIQDQVLYERKIPPWCNLEAKLDSVSSLALPQPIKYWSISIDQGCRRSWISPLVHCTHVLSGAQGHSNMHVWISHWLLLLILIYAVLPHRSILTVCLTPVV